MQARRAFGQQPRAEFGRDLHADIAHSLLVFGNGTQPHETNIFVADWIGN